MRASGGSDASWCRPARGGRSAWRLGGELAAASTRPRAGARDSARAAGLAWLSNLFEAAGLEKGAPRPLADRLRPKRLAEVVGQDHLVGPEGTLTRMLRSGRLQSMILWGPPGSGKTTVARLLADETKLAFEQLSAIFSGVQDLRKAFDRAKSLRQTGTGTLLFIDEIHRFNRSQQDSFLPHMEDGTITLVGATTENPSFELNGALLSRGLVLVFHRLDDAALEKLLQQAEQEEGRALPLDAEAREALKAMADGDGRTALNMVDEVFGWLSRPARRRSAAKRSPAWCSGARRSTTSRATATTT